MSQRRPPHLRTACWFLTALVLAGCHESSPVPEEVGQASQAATGLTLTNSSGTTIATGGGVSVIVDPNVTITNASGNLTGATVTLGAGFVSSEDSLAFANTALITGTYVTNTGVLTLTGTATAAQYQAALAAVTYADSSSTPNTNLRSITFGLGTAKASSDNGHFYEVVNNGGLTWSQALSDAATRTYNGLHGYLATITSANENAFILAKANGNGWISGYTNLSSFPRYWYWGAGPENGGQFCYNSSSGTSSAAGYGYFNWAGGEPNNAGGETVAEFYGGSGGTWNDLSTSSVLTTYFVEYGGSSNDPSVSLQSTKNLQTLYKINANVTSSANPSVGGDPVTFTATLSHSTATGTVQFAVDGTNVGAAVTVSNGVAVSAAVTGLTVGNHSVTATYGGDATNATGSGTLTGGQTVAKFANGTGSCTSSTASARCTSGVCGSDGVCGYANGDGPCTSPTTICRSNTCSVVNVCEPAGGCYVDADCTGGNYCKRSTFTCTAKGASGTAIPASDGLHDGTCNGAAVQCLSGACNTTTVTCAGAVGAGCTATNQCTNNICGSNHLCGYANGDSGCTSNTTAVCQSGACSSSGNCEPVGGCYVDGDCASGKYCERSSFTCKTKVASGTAVPNDGLHGGTCASAAATCASGACNATTSTCAGANGAACTAGAGNQCTNNVCGSNNQCGYANGQSGCTALTANVCQSATCNLTGQCYPAGGCYLDGDCASGNYCERSSFTCKAKLAPGSSIPNDGLHGGTCASAAATCASGACNATTSTCASANGTTCTATNQCTNNVCGSNGSCGYANGQGGCTSSTTAVCQSGACSASNTCVPTGGCYADGDCGPGKYCERSSFTCKTKVAAGSAVPNDTLHDGTCASAAATCASGLCNATTSTCATANGIACTAGNQCQNNVCGSNGSCGYANGQSGCSAGTASLCQSATCSSSGNCEPAGGCYVDGECGSGKYCERSSFTCKTKVAAGVAVPNDTLHDGTCASAAATCASGLCNATTSTCALANGSACSASNQCTNGICGSNGSCGFANGQAGCTVATANLCQSGTCSSSGNCEPSGGCYVDGDCGTGKYCERSSFTCKTQLAAGASVPSDGLHNGTCATAGTACASGLCNATTSTCAIANGSACTANNQCTNNVCGTNGSCGFANGQSGCTSATASLCQSGVCSASGNCAPSGGCYVDGDCAAGKYCERSSFTCKVKLASGTVIPNDTLHDGTCTDDNAAATCATGKCNPTKNTCADPAGTVCTSTTTCVSNVCSVNGKCGRANGEGPCTADNAATICQSGVCNATASGNASACIPAGSGSCYFDADCATGKFCSQSTFTCTSQLAPGGALPTDGAHAACGSDGTNAACATGKCNPITNTCASSNDGACTANRQCVTNVCGSNGECGLADGQAGCTPTTGATACQSGVCSSSSGTCVAVGGCWTDKDCNTSQYCDRNGGACASLKLAGQAIPNDGLHDGTCTTLNATETCATGKCNATTNTCAAAANAGCASASDCASNICGSNGKCGFADGQLGCTAATAAQCQSGICSSQGGACIPAGGCYVDGDCATAQFCNRSTLACAGKEANGVAIPDDTLHDGTCTDANAKATCTSGTCNKVTNTCAAGAGKACTAAAECVLDVCGSNGKCGLADGQGDCNALGKATCQSGVCSASGLCMETGACVTTADCTTAQYCEISTNTCVARLTAGASLPTGVECSSSGGSDHCAGGLCNLVTGTCGGANGTACTTASQCASNACGVDGLCGSTGGVACTSDGECRSGSCENDACTGPVVKNDGIYAGGGGPSCALATAGDDEGTSSRAPSGALFLAAVALVSRLRRRQGTVEASSKR